TAAGAGSRPARTATARWIAPASTSIRCSSRPLPARASPSRRGASSIGCRRPSHASSRPCREAEARSPSRSPRRRTGRSRPTRYLDGPRPRLFAHRGPSRPLPAPAALLEAFPGVPLNIEIKQRAPPIEAAVLATLDRAAARERTLLAAEDPAVMARIRAAAPDVLTSFSAAEVAEFVFRLRDG